MQKYCRHYLNDTLNLNDLSKDYFSLPCDPDGDMRTGQNIRLI